MNESFVHQFSQTLEDFRTYFLNQSHSLQRQIRTCTEKFTDQDRRDFDQVLNQIKEFAENKLFNFINTRIQTKSKQYIDLIEEYDENTGSLHKDLEAFSADITEQAKQMILKEQKSEERLIKITEKYSKREMLRKGFQGFRQNRTDNIKQKKMSQQARLIYETKLKKISFFPWRALTYKDGYQNSVKRQNLAQIRRVHSQFDSIVTVLKQKIMETDELLKTKRAAKNEFTYALSKNLLKTISNLSLEVMSLNQVQAINENSEKETERFLSDVHERIRKRVENATVMFRKVEEGEDDNPEVRMGRDGRKREESEERRQLPRRILSPQSKSNGKKISFA